MYKKLSYVLLFVLISVLKLTLFSCDEGGGGAGSSSFFTQGIASGNVREKEAILWTRVNQEAEVLAEVSTDCSFTQVDKMEVGKALAENDFIIKVTASDLEPDHTYCYRFKTEAAVSDVGTFRTAPSEGQDTAVRFAYSSDSDGSKDPPFNNFEVLDQVRLDDIDFWVYLGDTVYMDTFGPKAETLDEIRAKYKQNRDFAALRDLLKATSTYAIWDDHEVENDFDGQTVAPTLYANGRRAFLEYMPIQESGLLNDPTCAGNPLFRVFHWGKNVDIIILDERSCRSASVEEACEDDLIPTLPTEIRLAFGLLPQPPPGCLDAINDPARTMLGINQKEALKNVLLESKATWKLIINEVAISEFFALPYDHWEGYAAEREELLNFIISNNIKNVVFLTGDLHANLIGDVVLNRFMAPIPIANEIIAGPIAQVTLFERLEDQLGSADAVSALISLATLANLQCVHTNTFGYALVEANSDSLTITLKDDNGQQIQDQLNRPGASCTITIQAQ